MLKRGLDQLTAWILAIVVAGLVLVGGYFVARIGAAHAGDDDGAVSAHGGEEAPAHHGSASEHEPAAEPGHEPAHAPAPAHEPAHKPASEDHAPAKHESVGHDTGAVGGPNWEYKGSSGPDHWGDLAAGYKVCGTGSRQSPVDIDETATNTKLLPIKFNYKADDAVIKNDGRTVQANFPTGNYVEIDGERFDLFQIHVHAPSEHKVSGIPYDMEVHLDHKNVDGQLVSIAVLFEEGEENKALRPLWQAMPREIEQAPEPIEFNPATLLPARRLYYSYTGSLTVPPCTEGVRWFVLTQPVGVSSKQVDHFASIIPYNARPVQPLKGRKIAKSSR